MQLSTGRITIPLQFDNGDVEYISINPHDNTMQDRIKSFEESVKKRINEINLDKYKEAFGEEFDLESLDFTQLMDMPQEDLEKVTKQTEAIQEIDKELEAAFCAEIDSIFGGDISSKAFKYVPPLTMIEVEGGKTELYLLHFIHALAVEVQKYGKKMNAATNKYVEKYQKQK